MTKSKKKSSGKSKILVKRRLGKTVAKKKKKKGKKVVSFNTKSLPNVNRGGGHFVAVNKDGNSVVMGAKAPTSGPMNPVQLLRFMATQNYATMKSTKKKKDESSSEEES